MFNLDFIIGGGENPRGPQEDYPGMDELISTLRDNLLAVGVPEEVLDNERVPFMSPSKEINELVEQYFHLKKLQEANKKSPEQGPDVK